MGGPLGDKRFDLTVHRVGTRVERIRLSEKARNEG